MDQNHQNESANTICNLECLGYCTYYYPSDSCVDTCQCSNLACDLTNNLPSETDMEPLWLTKASREDKNILMNKVSNDTQ